MAEQTSKHLIQAASIANHYFSAWQPSHGPETTYIRGSATIATPSVAELLQTSVGIQRALMQGLLSFIDVVASVLLLLFSLLCVSIFYCFPLCFVFCRSPDALSHSEVSLGHTSLHRGLGGQTYKRVHHHVGRCSNKTGGQNSNRIGIPRWERSRATSL